MPALLPDVSRDGDDPLPGVRREARRTEAHQTDDGVCRDMPNCGALHASQFASPCARLRGVRRDLHRMRQGLRARRRDGRLRDGMYALCRKLPGDGRLIDAVFAAGQNIAA
ncbi:hypothetical protein chiPu_0030944 [Chiloscyllium punctatum]|uniref:Uncharacterized protein n=1 Tax=Chiloscyllium punctatum TaxID=137246 RepID=A0A401TVW8_CHIPU|nr:hypothetical protein [Chiloscyllium punctatum]